MNRIVSGILAAPLIAAQSFLGGMMPNRGVTVVVRDGISDFVLVRPSDSPFAVKAASANLSRAIKNQTGASLAQYTDRDLPQTVKKQNVIRIGFSEDAEKRGISLSYRDFAVFADDGNLCIAAGNEKAFAGAVDYIADEYIRENDLIVPNTPYVFHDDYAYENRTLFGKKLYDITLVYNGPFGKTAAQNLADKIRTECGKMPNVTDMLPENGVYMLFCSGNGTEKAAYRITAEQNGVRIEASCGDGMEKAASLWDENLFSQTEKEVKIMNIADKLSKGTVYEKEIIARAPLAGTKYKLEQEKKLRVAYFGGSVTVGYGASDTEKYSWRARTTAWLKKNYPDADITEINAAVGATGSYLGSYRTERDILSQKPDLLFVEFVVNDVYCGETAESAAIHYESILRRVRRENPTCDIVAVYTADSGSTLSGGAYMQQKAHDNIASLYNVPSVNIGRALTRTKNLDGNRNAEWGIYFIDGVHPTDEGYGVYADVIAEFLRNELIFEQSAETAPEHALPDVKHTEADFDLLYDTAKQDMLTDSVGWTFEDGTFSALKCTPYVGYLYTKEKNNRLSYTFTGNELAVYMGDYTAGTIRYSVDGGEEKTAPRNSMNNPFVLVKNLADGTHTVTISVDFSDKTSPSCKIGAFLPRVYAK